MLSRSLFSQTSEFYRAIFSSSFSSNFSYSSSSSSSSSSPSFSSSFFFLLPSSSFFFIFWLFLWNKAHLCCPGYPGTCSGITLKEPLGLKASVGLHAQEFPFLREFFSAGGHSSCTGPPQLWPPAQTQIIAGCSLVLRQEEWAWAAHGRGDSYMGGLL